MVHIAIEKQGFFKYLEHDAYFYLDCVCLCVFTCVFALEASRLPALLQYPASHSGK